MNQQLTENENEKVIEHLNYSNQSDVMAQRLFFDQTEIIRNQRINNEKIVEVLKTIASDNPSEAARKEASRTLTYLGVTPPPINPQLSVSINQSESKPKRLASGYFLLSRGVIVTWVLINIISFSLNNGIFSSWVSLGSSPGGTKRIIGPSAYGLLVESQDGKFYEISFGYGEFAEFRYGWQTIDNISGMLEQQNLVIRGSDCKKLGSSPFVSNPRGQIVECVYEKSTDSSYGEEIQVYYALMSDGNVFLWQQYGDSVFTLIIALFLLVAWIIQIPLTIAAIIALIYLIIYSVIRIRHAAG